MKLLKKPFHYRLMTLGLVFILSLSACTKVTEIIADTGNAKAQFKMGMLCHDSLDYYEAAEWLRKSAEQGYSPAQFSLGLAYNRGEGVRQDYDESIKWIKASAYQNNANAQRVLGSFYNYNNGYEGVSFSADIAKEWFGKSCDNGDQYGCDSYRKLN